MAEYTDVLTPNSLQHKFNINVIPEVSNTNSLENLSYEKYAELDKVFTILMDTPNKVLLSSHKVKLIEENIYSYRINSNSRLIYGEKDNIKTFLDYIVIYKETIPAYNRYINKITKRLLDIIGGILGISLTFILALFIVPAIIIENPGPLLFKQVRIGKNGKRFWFYKFRTMFNDADERRRELMVQNAMTGLMFKIQDDPRITKVGKFLRKTSLDELPQFFSVLKGDMSLVGPRAPVEKEFLLYEERHKKRLAAKPGLTGLWHISSNNENKDLEDAVRMDIEYIEHWSLFMDLKILLKTILPIWK